MSRGRAGRGAPAPMRLNRHADSAGRLAEVPVRPSRRSQPASVERRVAGQPLSSNSFSTSSEQRVVPRRQRRRGTTQLAVLRAERRRRGRDDVEVVQRDWPVALIAQPRRRAASRMASPLPNSSGRRAAGSSSDRRVQPALAAAEPAARAGDRVDVSNGSWAAEVRLGRRVVLVGRHPVVVRVLHHDHVVEVAARVRPDRQRHLAAP